MRKTQLFPLVSIITPCFNGEAFVERILNSILCQTYNNIELIFINDGSTDNTEIIVESYVSKFKSNQITLIYIKQENKGVAEAINKGLSICHGKYITWPDSDDFLHKYSISKRVNFLERNKDIGFVRCNGYLVKENSGEIHKLRRLFNRPNRFNLNIFDDILFKKTMIIPASYMIKSSDLFNIYPDKKIYVSRHGQNYQILLPLASRLRCGFLDEYLVSILVRTDSLSRKKTNYTNSIMRMNDNEKIIKYTLTFCDCNYEDYYNKTSDFYSRLRLKNAVNNSDRDLSKLEYNYLKKRKVSSINDDLTYLRGKYILLNFLFTISVFALGLIRKLVKRMLLIKKASF